MVSPEKKNVSHPSFLRFSEKQINDLNNYIFEEDLNFQKSIFIGKCEFEIRIKWRAIKNKISEWILNDDLALYIMIYNKKSFELISKVLHRNIIDCKNRAKSIDFLNLAKKIEELNLVTEGTGLFSKPQSNTESNDDLSFSFFEDSYQPTSTVTDNFNSSFQIPRESLAVLNPVTPFNPRFFDNIPILETNTAILDKEGFSNASELFGKMKIELSGVQLNIIKAIDKQSISTLEGIQGENYQQVRTEIKAKLDCNKYPLNYYLLKWRQIFNVKNTIWTNEDDLILVYFFTTSSMKLGKTVYIGYVLNRTTEEVEQRLKTSYIKRLIESLDNRTEQGKKRAALHK